MNYNPNVRNGIHKVKMTLQQWEYIGEIIFEVGGNCKGKSILECAMDVYEEDIIENSCNFSYFDETDDDGDNWFKCILKDDDGNEMEVEDKGESLEDYIVGIEIIDFKEKED